MLIACYDRMLYLGQFLRRTNFFVDNHIDVGNAGLSRVLMYTTWYLNTYVTLRIHQKVLSMVLCLLLKVTDHKHPFTFLASLQKCKLLNPFQQFPTIAFWMDNNIIFIFFSNNSGAISYLKLVLHLTTSTILSSSQTLRTIVIFV